MGMYDSPSPPPAPDYAAANVAGVKADAESLPFRLAISQAAAQGKAWTDPETGKVYDFTGLGNSEFIQQDIANQERLMTAGAELAQKLERDRLQAELELLPEYNRLNLEQQNAALDMALQKSKEFTANNYEQELAYRGKFGDVQRAEDEKTWQQNLRLGQDGTRAFTSLQEELMPRLAAMSGKEAERVFSANLDQSRRASTQAFNDNLDQADTAAGRSLAQQQRILPSLNDLGLRMQGDAIDAANAAGRRANGTAFEARDRLGAQIASELAKGGELTDAQRTRNQQAVRRAQAARGAILGDAAAFDEALSESELAEMIDQQRKTNALNFINSRDLAPSFASVSTVNPSQVVSPNNGVVNPTNTAVQPVNPMLPNYASSGPVNPTVPNVAATTAAGPNLSPATITPTNPLAMLNPNAGQAGATYAGNIWSQQNAAAAEQGNPWMEGLGMVAGVGLGAFTGGLGTAAAGALTRRKT